MADLKRGHETAVPKLPSCQHGGVMSMVEYGETEEGRCIEEAKYDARTWGGTWGYFCEKHFNEDTPGETGVGKGQKLIVVSW